MLGTEFCCKFKMLQGNLMNQLPTMCLVLRLTLLDISCSFEAKQALLCAPDHRPQYCKTFKPASPPQMALDTLAWPGIFHDSHVNARLSKSGIVKVRQSQIVSMTALHARLKGMVRVEPR